MGSQNKIVRRRRPITLADALAQHSGQLGENFIGIDADTFERPSGPAQNSPLVRNIYPPWVFKLPMSKDFSRSNYASVLAAGAGQTVTPVSFDVPPSFVGFCQEFDIYALSPLATTNIVYTLRINGGPVEGFDSIPLPPGATNLTLIIKNDLQVRLPDGCTVDVLVTNQDAAGPWTVGAVIGGWYHPESEEQRIYGTL